MYNPDEDARSGDSASLVAATATARSSYVESYGSINLSSYSSSNKT